MPRSDYVPDIGELTLVCEHCGEPFTYTKTNGPRRRFCTKRCGMAAAHARRAKAVRRCACGSTDVPRVGKAVCKAHRKADRNRTAENRRRRLAMYGLTPEQFDDMVREQRGRCGSCGDEPDDRGLFIDHDHACCPGIGSCGNCVRGLLCHHCNCLLGNARDSIDRLQKAVRYLQVHGQFRLPLKVVK
jgi:hypothetical protein